MKIAFANILYSKKHQRGGLGTHISTLSRELTRRGHDVTILTSGEGLPYFENEVRIVPLGRMDTFSHSLQVLSLPYLFRRLTYMISMTRYVVAHEFDIVEMADGGFEQLFLAAFSRRRCSLVTKLHGNFRLIYSGHPWIGYLAEKAERFAVRKSDGVYASTVEYAAAVARVCDISLKDIRIIPYAIDVACIDHLKSFNLLEQYPEITGKKLIFLSVGSSPLRKGALLFLEVASHSKRDDLHFVLSCNDRQFLKNVRIPPNVLVVTELDQCQFHNWLRFADVVVFPSAGESFCIAAHEAMLLGKAIVVSKCIPLEGIDLAHPNCIVLPSLQSSSLAQAISHFVDGKDQYRAIEGEFRRQFVQRYGISTVADQTEQFYLWLRSSPQARAPKHKEDSGGGLLRATSTRKRI
jgi:glycosyltransferase involved in cell wall biosynthesis